MHIELLNIKANSVSTSPRRYEALREKDEIRLLVLEPGAPDHDVCCTLHHVRLSEDPEYEALSYMWGSEEYPILLDVDGHERFIRNNLWQALKHLRYPNKKRILWVDAICIDQSNNKERGHQVAQMSEIYAQATNVRLWLGLDDKDGSVRATFDHLKNWRRIGHRHRLSHPTRHLQELCTRPYWSRLWIIQEIVLATRITVQCGYSICDWADLDAALRLTSNLDLSVLAGTAAKAVSLTREARLQVSNPNAVALFTLFKAHEYAQCSDVRDKIFGLHSFALDCCCAAVPIDYSISASELCGKVLYHHYFSHATDEEKSEIIRDSEQIFVQFGVSFPSNPDTRGADLSCAPYLLVRTYGCCTTTVVSTTPALGLFTLLPGPDSQLKYLSLIQDRMERWMKWDLHARVSLQQDVQRALRLCMKPTTSTKVIGQVTADGSAAPTEGVNTSWHSKGIEDNDKIFEIIKIGAELVKRGEAQDCLFFIGHSGNGLNMGFAPIGTKVGDMICKFKGSKAAAVIRPDDVKMNSFIGRAGMFFPFAADWKNESNLVDVSLSLDDLQMLAALSSEFGFRRMRDEADEAWIRREQYKRKRAMLECSSFCDCRKKPLPRINYDTVKREQLLIAEGGTPTVVS